MTHLIIKKKNEVFVTIDSEQYVYHELSDHFTFEVPGAKFMPQYRNKYCLLYTSDAADDW